MVLGLTTSVSQLPASVTPSLPPVPVSEPPVAVSLPPVPASLPPVSVSLPPVPLSLPPVALLPPVPADESSASSLPHAVRLNAATKSPPTNPARITKLRMKPSSFPGQKSQSKTDGQGNEDGQIVISHEHARS